MIITQNVVKKIKLTSTTLGITSERESALSQHVSAACLK